MGDTLIIRPSRSSIILRLGSVPADSGGGGAVDSVFARTGAVVAQSGDYSAFYAPTGAQAAAEATAAAALAGHVAAADPHAGYVLEANLVDLTFPKKPSTSYYHRVAAVNTTAGSSSAITLNRVYYVRFPVTRQITITQIGTATTSPVAGTISYALYNTGADGLPSSLIVDCGDASTTAAGDKLVTLATPQVLEPGEYCIAIWVSASTIVHSHVANIALPFFRAGTDVTTGTAVTMLYEAKTWDGSFPATAGALTELATSFATYWR